MLRATLLISLVVLASAHAATQSATDGDKLLPERVGDLRSEGKPTQIIFLPNFKPDDFAITATEMRAYVGASGEKFRVGVIKTRSAAAAYSLLGYFAHSPAASNLSWSGGPRRIGTVDGTGVLGITVQEGILFIKGDTLVDVEGVSEKAKGEETTRAFVKQFADTLPGEAGFVPVLALHLPDYDKQPSEGVGYAVSLAVLKEEAGARPVLDALSFDEGTEAVTAKYGDARLVIVEFPTPQHAFDADAAVNRRIAELSAAGQPVPSSYKRVGNYSVFVFDAPDGPAADKLVSGVKYEKDVRWLGRNPHAEEIATRAYTSTMGGVIMTTLITTGLAILLCLTVGGVIGGAVFLSRRARHAAQEIYSDAGGMLRLNIEDLNTPPPTTKMLGRVED
jgi:hypothetical protein